MDHATLRFMLQLDQIAPEVVRPLKRSEYDRLVELGVFDGEKLELLRGALVTMSPQGAPHANTAQRLTKRLILALGERAEVRCQFPFAATEDSEPEPDIAVVPVGDYFTQHPTTAHLIVEVADSSLRKDRVVKPAIYATAGVSEYWIINLREGGVERLTMPVDGEYTKREQLGRGDRIALLEFPDVVLAVDEILPPAPAQ